MKKILLALLFNLLLFVPSRADISQSFSSPDDPNAKPWCFWYWMYGAITREGITTDLEAMAANGLGGTYLMPIRTIEDKPEMGGTVRQLSPEWYAMVDWAMQEADRLGLKLGMHICDGFALAGGPWITPEESMQKVVMTPIDSEEGTTLGYYFLPAKYMNGENPFGVVPSTRPDTTGLYRLKVEGSGEDLKIDTLNGGFQAKKPFTIEYTFPYSITASALELELPSTQFQAQRLNVFASSDGLRFRHVKQLVPARTGWQNYDFNTTHSIPTTTAKYWRFEWTPEGTLPGCEDYDQAKWSPTLKVKRIYFHPAPRINQWEGKSGLVWRISSQADNTLESRDYIPTNAVIKVASPHNVTDDASRFYFRLASVSTGHDNATGGDGKGLECDKFSRTAVQKQLNGWFNSHFYAPVPGRDSLEHLQLAKRVLKYMHVDSWECGSQNWSPEFAQEFQKRRGYDIMPYLPLFVGIPLESEETSERVLRDVRITINELVQDVFYDELRRNALLMDCRFSAESVCPTMVSDGMEHYRQADLPMGEFWLNSPTHDKINDMLDAISGGHVYGKRIIQAEGFTELRGVFDEDPAMLKPLLDRNFCLGINRLFYHVYCLNPDPSKRPGMTLDGIGLFFQKGNTWFDEGAEFTRYATRCQYLLQLGRPVVDLAVYTGQEMPRRAFQPDRLVPMLPGIFGPDRVASERERMANRGVPVGERPVGVKYCTNMLTPDQWINPMHGYQYDSFNQDALLRSRVDKTDDGPSALTMTSIDDAAPRYRLLILPKSHLMDPDGIAMPEAVTQRMQQLRAEGVQILTADQLPWNEADFSRLGIQRDVASLPEGIAWCHRSCEQAEIYFLSNQTDTLQLLRPQFRDGKDRAAELWDPLDGSIRPLLTDSIQLQPYGSIFVVFPAVPTAKDELQPSLALESALGDESVFAIEPAIVQDTLPRWHLYFHDIDTHIDSDTLPDWSHSADPRIRYYSGRVTYSAEFDASSFVADAKGRYYLRLNEVANLATIRVNGQDCGVAWTAPYEVDVTDALKPGRNTLEIIVVNTWSNAIQGHDEGHDPFPNIWTNARYRKSGSELLPAGLFGPVVIVKK